MDYWIGECFNDGDYLVLLCWVNFGKKVRWNCVIRKYIFEDVGCFVKDNFNERLCCCLGLDIYVVSD